MKTKKVTYYVDLNPGWQDYGSAPLPYGAPPETLLKGWKRFCIEVELPCIGGSALAEEMPIRGEVSEQ